MEYSTIEISLVAIYGIMVGSFLNSVIYRLPHKEKKLFSKDRSVCPCCGHQILWYENIPVISYAFLQGKCSACKTSISYQYPLVELTNMGGWVLVHSYYGLSIGGVLGMGMVSVIMVVIGILWDIKSKKRIL